MGISTSPNENVLVFVANHPETWSVHLLRVVFWIYFRNRDPCSFVNLLFNHWYSKRNHHWRKRDLLLGDSPDEVGQFVIRGVQHNTGNFWGSFWLDWSGENWDRGSHAASPQTDLSHEPICSEKSDLIHRKQPLPCENQWGIYHRVQVFGLRASECRVVSFWVPRASEIE